MKKNITVMVCLFFILTLLSPLQVIAQQNTTGNGKDRNKSFSVQEGVRPAPAAPKTTFYTKKLTPKTQKIKIKMAKTVKNHTYVVCDCIHGKEIEHYLRKEVKNGKTSLKVNLKKLKKGDKVKITAYTTWWRGNGEKMMRKKYGTSKVFVVR